jgi:hypothetical protein
MCSFTSRRPSVHAQLQLIFTASSLHDTTWFCLTDYHQVCKVLGYRQQEVAHSATRCSSTVLLDCCTHWPQLNEQIQAVHWKVPLFGAVHVSEVVGVTVELRKALTASAVRFGSQAEHRLSSSLPRGTWWDRTSVRSRRLFRLTVLLLDVITLSKMHNF